MDELVIKKTGVLSVVRRILSSDYFPVFTAITFLISYYLGCDLINIYIYGAVLIAMILLLDDLSPVITQFLFLAIIASAENSPMYGNSDYYTQTAHFVQIACIIALIAVAAIYRFIRQARAGKVRVSVVFVSVVLLSAVYVANGLFSEEHASDDLLYGVILAASLLPAYMLLSCTVNLTERNLKKICTGFFIFSVVIAVELIVALYKIEIPLGEITSQYLRNNALKFGWGMWNNAGMLFVICIAPVLYLSLSKRGGGVFIIWATVLYLAVLATTSRQSYIGGTIAYLIGLVYVLAKSKKHKFNYVAALAVLAALAGMFVWIFKAGYGDNFIDTVLMGFFTDDGELSGSGRMNLWEHAWQNFLNNPVLGVGFYAENMQSGYVTSMTWFPKFYHNTIMQILGSCGAIGMVVYLFHRASTVIAFFKNRSTGRSFIAITVFVYLVMGLFDNHMYYILSAFIYPCLVVLITNPAEVKKEPEEVAPEEPQGYKAGEDEFLDGLTYGERQEFFKAFIEGKKQAPSVCDYVIGGDNERFFKDAFIYLGEMQNLSCGLMDKIFTYARKFDVK